MPHDFLEHLRELLESERDVNLINHRLQRKTGLRNFFECSRSIDEFLQFIKEFQSVTEKAKDLGDFQTPSNLTDKICKYLVRIGFIPDTLIEPTCGTGNFIFSALKYFPSLKYIYCIELQKIYEWVFKLNLLQFAHKQPLDVKIEFHRDNIFIHHFSPEFLHFLNHATRKLLVIGNPPWITNTELSMLESQNVPLKSNIKHDKGIEAITGKGNFDIAEYIILRMIQKFSNHAGKIAMLCKTSVIKNIVKNLRRLNLKLTNIKSILIDAKKEFNINAEAALFLADLNGNNQKFCTISTLEMPEKSLQTFGWVNGKFVSDISLYKKYMYIEGKSPYIWRQGIKHDASKVMVLLKNNGFLLNGFNKTVSIEEDLLYPFLKSSDLKSKVIKETNRWVIITQHSLKEKTHYIASSYPKTWNYLISYSQLLDTRKSVIYKNRPRFSIFGIGEYAFKPYKVAISGFYKHPQFSLIFPIDNKPTMLDDTCYYLYFDTFQDAFFTWLLLSCDETHNFLSSIVFFDSKRPYTKEILMRIDLGKLLKLQAFETYFNFYQNHLKQYIEFQFSEKDFKSYSNKILNSISSN